jgi:hypothetical protein
MIVEPLLWLVAQSMAFVSAWLLKRSSVANSSIINSVVFYVLVMMAAMFVGAVLYFEKPGQYGLAEALGLNMIVMTVGVLVVLHYWTKDDKVEENVENSDEAELQRSIVISRAYVIYFLVMMASMSTVGITYVLNITLIGLNEGLVLGNVIMIPGVFAILWYASKHPGDSMKIPGGRSIRVETWTLVFFVLLNEFVMGWAFVLASGTSPVFGSGSVLQVIALTLYHVTGSDWFLFTLAFEIVISVVLLRKFFSRVFVMVAILQSVILFFVPTAISGKVWTDICVLVEIAVLAGLIAFSYPQLTRNRSSMENYRTYLKTLLILDSLVVVGTLIWATDGNALVLLPCLVAETVLYFNAILERVGVEKSKLSLAIAADSSTAKV